MEELIHLEAQALRVGVELGWVEQEIAERGRKLRIQAGCVEQVAHCGPTVSETWAPKRQVSNHLERMDLKTCVCVPVTWQGHQASHSVIYSSLAPLLSKTYRLKISG